MNSSADGALLDVVGLAASYGRKPVLHDVHLRAWPGEIVALIGHNGAGKSTLLKALFGIIPASSGQMLLGGLPVIQPTPRRMISAGVAYVPQTGSVFPELSVRENLDVAAGALRTLQTATTEHDVFTTLPGLRPLLDRLAGSLSGGQRQLVGLAMGLLHAPRLLLLDEPSLGLAPALVEETFGWIRRLSREQGIAIILVEQKVRQALEIADHAYVLRRGTVTFAGEAAMLGDPAVLGNYFL